MVLFPAGVLLPLRGPDGKALPLVKADRRAVLPVHVECQALPPLLGPLQQRPPDPPGPGGTPDKEPRQIVADQSRKALEPLPVLIDEHLGGGQRRPHLLHMVTPIALRKKAVGFQVGVQPDLHHLVQILRTESPDHNAVPPLTAR